MVTAPESSDRRSAGMPNDPTVTSAVFGRYVLLGVIGRGGMGEVWRAHDTATDRIVALKVLVPQIATDGQFEERFRREARAAAALYDPHVVPIHGYGEIDGRLYVDMRLINGRGLDVVLADGPMEPARAVDIVDQVASALQAAHRAGLIHRDVKPSNILVTESDFAYLIDFGIAAHAEATSLTTAGSTMGTWAYMAPERFGAGEPDLRSDVYALTCVLYECLTGRRPFPGDRVEQQLAGHLSTPPPRPSEFDHRIPRGFDAIVSRGMAKSAADRFRTATELAVAVRVAIGAAPPSTSPPSQGVDPSAMTMSASAFASAMTAPAAVPDMGAPSRPVPLAPRRGSSRMRRRWLAATAVVVAAVVVAIAGYVFSGPHVESATAAVPPAAPFDGTFTVQYGPKTTFGGRALNTKRGQASAWVARSACDRDGCSATARPLRSDAGDTALTFDYVDGRWRSVGESVQDSCGIDENHVWQTISLQPGADGSMSGQVRVATSDTDCTSVGDVSFTRTGDVAAGIDVDAPAKRLATSRPPIETLSGHYHYVLALAGSNKRDEFDFNARTDCLRTGNRCLSYFNDQRDDHFALLFADGGWTQVSSFTAECPRGAKTRVTRRAQIPVPAASDRPFDRLSGRGTQKQTGGCVATRDFTVTLTRLGS